MKLTQKRRYYLHAKIKKSFKMDAYSRSVFVPQGQEDEAMKNKFVKELQSGGYNIQITIPNGF